jgi:hypothetical protein
MKPTQVAKEWGLWMISIFILKFSQIFKITITPHRQSLLGVRLDANWVNEKWDPMSTESTQNVQNSEDGPSGGWYWTILSHPALTQSMWDYLRIDSIRTGVLLVGIDSRLEDKLCQRKVTVKWHPKSSLEALKGQSKIITRKLSNGRRPTRNNPFYLPCTETYSTVTEPTRISRRKQLYVRNKWGVWITGPGGIVFKKIQVKIYQACVPLKLYYFYSGNVPW